MGDEEWRCLLYRRCFFLLDSFGISFFNPFQVPLLNTVILISSGIRVTWAHHTLIIGNYSQTKIGLTLTVVLGLYFTILQILEYYEASFTFADSIYGSTFFIATGFHGLHVIIGTLFLLVMLMRHINYEFSKTIILALKQLHDIDISLMWFDYFYI